MTTQIEKLIDQLADKTLSFGKFEEIELPNGSFTKVSPKHFSELRQKNWNTNVKGYVVIGSNFLHHEILRIEKLPMPTGWQTDHINGDILDNRIENLRAVTVSQNHMNQRKTKGTSIYKGVSNSSRVNQPWISNIKIDGKTYNLGRFTTQEKAGREYDRIAKFIYGEYALLNFPRRHPITIGRVLEKLREKQLGSEERSDYYLEHSKPQFHAFALDIIKLWMECGINKSLQQIIGESGLEETKCHMNKEDMNLCSMHRWHTHLKNPNAQNLFNYLISVFE